MHLLMCGVTAPSHIYPSLALISELVDRGHQVSYVVGDRLTELVEPTGAQVVPHPSALPVYDEAWPEDPGEAMHLFLDDAISALPYVEEVDRVDAVLYDIGGYAGRVDAIHRGVPAIQLSPAYVAWDGYEQDNAEVLDAIRSSPSGQRYYGAVREWLDQQSVDLDADTFLGRPDSCVVLVPRPLQPHADRVGDQYVFAGPCIDTSRTTGWAPAAGDDRPLVYVSLGTAYIDRQDIYRMCVDELSATHRLVIATGKVEPADLEPLPAGVQVARHQPQLDVLAHASVFVTHAGMGGASESLWFGVPTVAIPQAADQFLNAATLEQIGAGVHLADEQLDGTALRDAVRTAAGRAARVLELREQVRGAGGTDKAADAVEHLAASRT